MMKGRMWLINDELCQEVSFGAANDVQLAVYGN